jgi:hypothetical protein
MANSAKIANIAKIERHHSIGSAMVASGPALAILAILAIPAM